MKNVIVELMIIIAVGSLLLALGFDGGKRSVVGKVVEVPAKYSNKQVDDLINHNIVLTNLIAEQLKYEESFTK